jgi:hypothetical protein
MTLSKQDLAANAIRDMFLSKQYRGRIPFSDIDTVLKSPAWHRAYGKKPLKSAWKSMVKGQYATPSKDGIWVWFLVEEK